MFGDKFVSHSKLLTSSGIWNKKQYLKNLGLSEYLAMSDYRVGSEQVSDYQLSSEYQATSEPEQRLGCKAVSDK